MNYDTWISTETDAGFDPEPEEKPCESCGASGQEQVGSTTKGEPVLDNCVVCGGEGCV